MLTVVDDMEIERGKLLFHDRRFLPSHGLPSPHEELVPVTAGMVAGIVRESKAGEIEGDDAQAGFFGPIYLDRPFLFSLRRGETACSFSANSRS